MFVIPTNVGFTHRVVAMLVACAVVLWSIGVYTTAQAANLIEVSDTLTDSGPNALSGHLFSFEIPTGSTVGAANDYVITFNALFTGVAGVVSGDLTVRLNNGAPIAIGNFAAAATTLTFDNVVANATSDTGRTQVAIVDYVTVSAIINTTFDFVVSGLATSTSVNSTTTSGATTATQIPFGVLSAGTVYTLAQGLSVQTNAANGFVVTVEQDADLLSSTGADIDSFSNATYVNTPTAWTAPSNTLLNENTWGHWGLTSDDTDLNAGEFTSGGGDKWVAASTTPRIVFSHNDPVNGTTQGIGTTTVGYRVQITPLQEAGDDYNTTLMYIATPTF